MSNRLENMDEKMIEIKEILDILYLNERSLSSAQLDFIQGAKKYFSRNGELSDRQLKILKEIRKYLPELKEIRMSNKIMEK